MQILDDTMDVDTRSLLVDLDSREDERVLLVDLFCEVFDPVLQCINLVLQILDLVVLGDSLGLEGGFECLHLSYPSELLDREFVPCSLCLSFGYAVGLFQPIDLVLFGLNSVLVTSQLLYAVF